MSKLFTVIRFFLLFWIGALMPSIVSAQVSETIDNTSPAPGSVDELAGPIELAFPDIVEPPPAQWKGLAEIIADKHTFWSDMKLAGNFRTYYFLRENTPTSLIETNEAWAGGGMINFESGRLWETISFGAEAFLSAPINASDSKPGTGLLEPIQDPIAVIGQAFVRGTFGEQVVTLGRQRIDKPFLNGNESRMLPNTFEAATWDGRWQQGRFFVGYVDKLKVRNSDEFISMGRRAGVAGSDEGLWELGGRYEWGGGNYFGLISSIVPDILATTYSELDMRWDRAGDWSFRFGAQLADQRSIGDDLLPGPSFDTQSFGARLSASINHLVFSAVVTSNGDEAAFRSPFGGYPGLNSLMISDFNLANQTTYRVGISMQGAAFDVPWISGYMNYAQGKDAEIGATGESLPDDEEFDLTVDFKPTDGPFEDAWLRVRYGVLNPGGDRERYNIRVTVNWPFQLL
jgi:hypothetical protein